MFCRYCYKSYIEILLSYSKPTKQGRLQANCFFKDTAGKFDSLPVFVSGSRTVDSENQGYKNRRALLTESRWLYFCINLHTDLTTLRRYLPPNVKIEVNLERTSDSFSLMTKKTDMMIEIADLVLRVQRIKPQKRIADYHNTQMNTLGQCFLPVDRSLIKTYTIQAGGTDLSHYNFLSGGVLPDQVIIGMLDETAYNGTCTRNPYHFKHFNASEISLIVNGVHEPDDRYKMDVNKGDYVKIYNDFMENTGKKIKSIFSNFHYFYFLGVATDDRDFWVNPHDYINGSFLVVFDRTKDKCNRFHRHHPDSGTIDINIRLRDQTSSTSTIIVYATYSSDIIIDKDNKVFVEKL